MYKSMKLKSKHIKFYSYKSGNDKMYMLIRLSLKTMFQDFDRQRKKFAIDLKNYFKKY